jgi:lysophospholipid acyltransferase (LPLAT)-like uncharacterized protein
MMLSFLAREPPLNVYEKSSVMEDLSKPAAGSVTHTDDASLPEDAARAANPRAFTRWQRFQIFAISWMGYFALHLIGRTLRWEVNGWEHWGAARQRGKGLIYTFWHREIFPGTWFWRKRGIVVMTSRNFDGEYIARIIERHGYGAVRGSSSRGAVTALAELIRCHQQGLDTAFAIDGPRGPRFVAKPGAVMVARSTGAAILCFHFALRNAFVFRKSWDQFQIPYPFSRAAIFIAPAITVSADADKAEQDRTLREVQAALDGARGQGERWKKGNLKSE